MEWLKEEAEIESLKEEFEKLLFSKGYLSEAQAAKILNICYATLGNYRKKGDGPKCYRLGKRFLYKVEDLKNWVEKRVVPYHRGAD